MAALNYVSATTDYSSLLHLGLLVTYQRTKHLSIHLLRIVKSN